MGMGIVQLGITIADVALGRGKVERVWVLE